MSDFFNRTFQEQVHKAIDDNDLQLVQVLLGPKYCQLWRYWLVNSILSYDLTVVINTLNYQLPANILFAQSQVLAEYSTSNNLSYEQVQKINDRLKYVEQEILKKYENFNHNNSLKDKTECNSVSIRPMFDPVRKFDYHYTGSNYEYENNCIKEIIQKFGSYISLQPVLKLDLSQNYNNMYVEMSKKITEIDKFRVDRNFNFSKENELLNKKVKSLMDTYDKMDTMITNVSKVLNQIKDEKFLEEIHNQLLLNIAKRRDHNPFSPDDLIKINAASTIEEKIIEIKKKIKTNDDYRLPNRFMEYVVNKGKKEPNVNMINLLIVNGASLLQSYVIDPISKQSITIKEHFINNLQGKYATIVNKSIFTVMKDIHKQLLNFPIMKDNINLVDLISAVPSKNGNFSKDIKDVCIFDKIGGEGAKEFINLLQNSIDKCVNGKKASSSKDMWLKNIYLTLFGSNHDAVDSQDYKDACKKLYDSVNIGYLAIATGDNTVILDYINEIKYEADSSKNALTRELYNDFLKLLTEYQELPKSMFLYRWYYYAYRTVKSYTWEWNPAWKKILTGPGYCTNTTEWSKDRFDEKDNEAQEKNRQFDVERKEATKAIQAADEARQKAEELTIRTKKVMSVFSNKVSNLSGKELRAAANSSMEKIVEAVIAMDSPEEVLDTIMEKIKSNKKQIIKDGEVSDELLREVVLSSKLSDIDVSQSIGATTSRG